MYWIQFFFLSMAGRALAQNDNDPTLELEVNEAMQTVDKLGSGFMAVLPKMAIAIVVFGLFLVLARFVPRIIQFKSDSEGAQRNLRIVLGRLAKWVVVFVGLMISVAIVAPSVTPAKLLGVLGFGSVAIGFAFKDILQNFLAGILILVRQPFREGDKIVVGDYEGIVKSIETRSTILKTYDGKQVIVPNGQVYTSPIVVLTAYDATREQYDIGIGYGDDIGLACQTILKVLNSIEDLESDPGPDVVVSELASYTVNLRARWWLNPRTTNSVKVKHQIMKGIKEALDDAAIDMPYPTQVLLMHDQTEETDGYRSKQREGWPAGKTPPKPRYVVAHEENAPNQ